MIYGTCRNLDGTWGRVQTFPDELTALYLCKLAAGEKRLACW